ncbi:MAG: hypothetical protein FWH25_03845 [Syntrophorhabdaceae bacterium]|nr:hypothetical protein [Syntrophorhabdaceae bacterium]
MLEITCNNCEIRVSTKNQICPFCRKPLIKYADEEQQEANIREQQEANINIRKLLVAPDRLQEAKEFYRQHKKWVKPALIALPVVIVLLVVLLASRKEVVALPVEIMIDPIFPIKVEKERDEVRGVILKGLVMNNGEDIRGLSLRSLSVMVEFKLINGNVENKRVFPKSVLRDDGSLFNGEAGAFEIVVPPNVITVTLQAEVLDLGEDRRFRVPLHLSDPNK